MKNIIVGIIVLGIIGFVFIKSINLKPLIQNDVKPSSLPESINLKTSEESLVEVIAENLDTPWAIAFLPDKSMLVTERVGRVRFIDSSGKLQQEPIAVIESAKEIGEGGLLGITLHPDFSANNFIYLYYTYSSEGDNTLNRVVRMIYKNNKLTDEKTIVDKIPGASNHNGGRIKFGPDKLLYITTGDAGEPSLAQDKNSLAGKILRVNKEGKVEIFSYGHRNPQGIAWDESGKLWETEHGPSGGSLGIGNDEINVIYAGKNYGWPEIQGDKTKDGMEIPIKHSGISTWAPAGIAAIDNKVFFGGLRGQALYMIQTDAPPPTIKEYFKNEFGRIREVIVGPDNMLYITTSNKDGRGISKTGDDKVIRINPQEL